jgi:peptide/nickel transport system substrate-binding protein
LFDRLAPVSRRAALRATAVLGLGGVLGGCTAERKDPRDTTKGGTLRLGALTAGAPASDPHGELPGAFDRYRMAAIYDVLTVPGPDGAMRPRLATSWERDAAATRWRFTLRPDAVFSDGRQVRAEDVLYSVLRAKRMAGRARLAVVDAGRSLADGDRTVVLATTAPEPELPRTVSEVFVVPARTTVFTEPVGSGPFLQALLRGNDAWLLPSDTWWGETRRIEQINLRGFRDALALENAIAAGELDAAGDVEPVAAALAAREQGRALVRTPDVWALGVLMRADRAPFDRPQVRRAVKLALDRQALVSIVLGGAGRPGNDVPTPSDPSFPADVAPAGTDRVRARELLAEAGFPDGLDVVLHTTDTRAAMAGSANAIAEQLAAIGIRVEVVLHPQKTYWSQVHDTEAFVVTCRSGTQFAEWAEQTAAAWPDRVFADRLAEATALTDGRARRTAFAALQREVAADGPEAVWGFADALDVTGADVRDMPTGPGLARMMLEKVWLAR